MRNIPFGKPMLGDEERNAVLDVMASGLLVHGPRVKAFEEEFAQFSGSPYCHAVSSCMAALHLGTFTSGSGRATR